VSQINFRINKKDLEIYKEIAESEGLSVAELAHEFMLEWAKRDAKEVIPDHIFEKHLKKAIDYDLSRLLNP